MYITTTKQAQCQQPADAIPVLCLVVHIDKDGGGGDGSHGGALVERWVVGDQVGTQVRTEHSCGGNIYMYELSLHLPG